MRKVWTLLMAIILVAIFIPIVSDIIPPAQAPTIYVDDDNNGPEDGSPANPYNTIQEAVDVVGLSSLAAGHMYHFPRVVELLAEKGMDNVLMIGGGIIPEEDILALKEKGVKEVFGPGSDVEEVAKYIRANVKQ